MLRIVLRVPRSTTPSQSAPEYTLGHAQCTVSRVVAHYNNMDQEEDFLFLFVYLSTYLVLWKTLKKLHDWI